MENAKFRKTILKTVKESTFAILEEKNLVWIDGLKHFEISKGRIGNLTVSALKEQDILCYFWDGKIIIHKFE